jgi:hypothetical protein
VEGLDLITTGTIQIVAPDGTVIAVCDAYEVPIPGWYPSVECIAAMLSEDV